MKKTKSVFKASKILIHSVLFTFGMFCLLPMILVVSISLTDEDVLLKNGYSFIPEKISLLAYQLLFKFPGQIINAYSVTIFVTVTGSVLGVLIITMLAYSISRRDYKYRNITSFIVFFTLMFNGGLIPWYIVISKYLHLKNALPVLFIPYLANAWYVLLMKGFLSSIPYELFESAKIDGAKELTIFYRIVLPLSKPGIATIALFYALVYWNDWWLPLLFIDNTKLVTLQLLLYRIMSNIQFALRMMNTRNMNLGNKVISPPELSTRMAMCILAAGPMLFVFPFFQKYFIRGLTVGSIKG